MFLRIRKQVEAVLPARAVIAAAMINAALKREKEALAEYPEARPWCEGVAAAMKSIVTSLEPREDVAFYDVVVDARSAVFERWQEGATAFEKLEAGTDDEVRVLAEVAVYAWAGELLGELIMPELEVPLESYAWSPYTPDRVAAERDALFYDLGVDLEEGPEDENAYCCDKCARCGYCLHCGRTHNIAVA